MHAHKDEASPTSWIRQVEQACAQKGLQLTPLRQAILAILAENTAPLGAYAIIEALSRREGKAIAPPTVYRTLDFLLEHGFLHKIESRNAYARCEHFDHAHQGVLLLVREMRAQRRRSRISLWSARCATPPTGPAFTRTGRWSSWSASAAIAAPPRREIGASERQPAADQRQRARQHRAAGRDRARARRSSCRSAMPGTRADQQRDQQRPVDRTDPPMAGAGDQRQRHGMGDVGADDAHGRHLGIEHQQGGDADRAGADRRDRNQHAEHRAERDRQARDLAFVALVERLRRPCASSQRRKTSVTAVRISAKPSTDVMIVAGRVGVPAEMGEREQGQRRGGRAARRRAAG